MKWNRLLSGLLGLAGAVLIALPIEAAQLQSWRFDAEENRLEFTTDTQVQPRAQLIFNPTRLVIDLPGTSLGGASTPQSVRQEGVQEVRVAQFDADTARIVIEFEPGYAVDPQQVQVRGETDRRWSVQLPEVEVVDEDRVAPRVARDGEVAASDELPPAPDSGLENAVTGASSISAETVIQGVTATADGFFVRTRGAVPEVDIEQERGGPTGRQLVLTFPDSAIAPTVTENALPVNRYSVSSWEHTQVSTSPPTAQIVLNLAEDSPDWNVISSDVGGAVILPDGVPIRDVPDGGSPPVAASVPATPPEPPEPELIEPEPSVRDPRPAEPRASDPVASGELPTLPEGRFLVVIDPGHGGRDPGAVGIGGLQEKQVIFPISLRVADLLQQQGVDVVMTRDRDIELGLDTRVQIAEGAAADFFVSIHANAINLSRPDVNGLETYYYSSRGQSFARDVHTIVLQEMGMNDRRVRQARFFVIRRTSMPAILIEVGFVTGEFDAPNLNDPAWREDMAVAIARGILIHLERSL